MSRTRSAAATVVAVLALGACLAALAALLAPAASADPTKHPHPTGSPTPSVTATPSATGTPSPSPSNNGAASLWGSPFRLGGERVDHRLHLVIGFRSASVSVPWHAGCWAVAAEGQPADFSCAPDSSPTVVPSTVTTHQLTFTFKTLHSPKCTGGAHVVSGLPVDGAGTRAFDTCLAVSCGQVTQVSFTSNRALLLLAACGESPVRHHTTPPPGAPRVGAHAPSGHAPTPPEHVLGDAATKTPGAKPAASSSASPDATVEPTPSGSPDAPAVVVADPAPAGERTRQGWQVAIAAFLVGSLGVASSRVLVRPRRR